MAEVTNSHIIGNYPLRIEGWDDLAATGTVYETLKFYDKALGSTRHHVMHLYPPSFYQIDLYIIVQIGAGTTGDSCRFTAPWPLTIWAADVGCEASAGSAATVDLYTDDGSTDASILDAPEDVHSSIGEGQRVAPEDGSEEVAYGTEIYIQGAATGGAVDGAQAHLYCQRR